jgi:hypothetical protein
MADPVSDLKNAVNAHFDAAVLRPVKAAVSVGQKYGQPMIDTLKNMVAAPKPVKRRTTDIFLPSPPKRRAKR